MNRRPEDFEPEFRAYLAEHGLPEPNRDLHFDRERWTREGKARMKRRPSRFRGVMWWVGTAVATGALLYVGYLSHPGSPFGPAARGPHSTAGGSPANHSLAPLWLPNHRSQIKGVPVSYVNFLDPEHGWKLAGLEGAMGSESAKIYATADGGRTWVLRSQANYQNPGGTGPAPAAPPAGIVPFVGEKTGLSFSGLDTGWLTGLSNAGGTAYLYATHDGGRDWQRVNLPVPAADGSAVISVSPPAFFSKSVGLLPVTFTVAPDRLSHALYATSDGGQTWSGPYEVPGKGQRGALSWSFVAADRGTVQLGTNAWKTTDGGLDWAERVTPIVADVAAPPLVNIHMSTVQNGWALSQPDSSGPRLLTTSDGGQTWNDVTPAGVSSQAELLADFQSPNLGWVAALRPDVSVTVYRTANGGKTWSNGVTFPVKYGDGNGRLQFADPQHGWIEVLTAGMGALQAQLFATADGGQTWSLVSSTGPNPGQMPFGNDLTFTNATTGYLTGAPRAAGGPNQRTWLYRTTDGGRTWVHQSLPYPADLTTGSVGVEKPVFFGQQGFLPVVVHTHSGSVSLLYLTTDGGQNWTLAHRSSLPLTYTFGDASDIWALDQSNRSLYLSQDTGRTWSTLPANAALSRALSGYYPSALTFVNNRDGWFLLQGLQTGSTRLLTTGDGGLSWQALDPKTPATTPAR